MKYMFQIAPVLIGSQLFSAVCLGDEHHLIVPDDDKWPGDIPVAFTSCDGILSAEKPIDIAHYLKSAVLDEKPDLQVVNPRPDTFLLTWSDNEEDK